MPHALGFGFVAEERNVAVLPDGALFEPYVIADVVPLQTGILNVPPAAMMFSVTFLLQASGVTKSVVTLWVVRPFGIGPGGCCAVGITGFEA